jgi:hypothetical protein
MTKNAIRKAYDKTLMGIDGFDNMRICFSRPQNLLDLLTNSVLKGSGEGEISSIIDSSKQEHLKQEYSTKTTLELRCNNQIKHHLF